MKRYIQFYTHSCCDGVSARLIKRPSGLLFNLKNPLVLFKNKKKRKRKRTLTKKVKKNGQINLKKIEKLRRKTMRREKIIAETLDHYFRLKYISKLKVPIAKRPSCEIERTITPKAVSVVINKKIIDDYKLDKEKRANSNNTKKNETKILVKQKLHLFDDKSRWHTVRNDLRMQAKSVFGATFPIIKKINRETNILPVIKGSLSIQDDNNIKPSFQNFIVHKKTIFAPEFRSSNLQSTKTVESFSLNMIGRTHAGFHQNQVYTPKKSSFIPKVKAKTAKKTDFNRIKDTFQIILNENEFFNSKIEIKCSPPKDTESVVNEDDSVSSDPEATEKAEFFRASTNKGILNSIPKSSDELRLENLISSLKKKPSQRSNKQRTRVVPNNSLQLPYGSLILPIQTRFLPLDKKPKSRHQRRKRRRKKQKNREYSDNLMVNVQQGSAFWFELTSRLKVALDSPQWGTIPEIKKMKVPIYSSEESPNTMTWRDKADDIPSNPISARKIIIPEVKQTPKYVDSPNKTRKWRNLYSKSLVCTNFTSFLPSLEMMNTGIESESSSDDTSTKSSETHKKIRKQSKRKGDKKSGLEDPEATAVSNLPDSHVSSRHSNSSSASSKPTSGHSSKLGSGRSKVVIRDPLSYDPKQFLSEGHQANDDFKMFEESSHVSGDADTFWLRLPRVPSRMAAVFSLPVQLKRLEAMTTLEYLQRYFHIRSSRKQLHKKIFMKFRDTESIRVERLPVDRIPSALEDALGSVISEELIKKVKRFTKIGDSGFIEADSFIILASLTERLYCQEMLSHFKSEIEARDLVEQLDFHSLGQTIEPLSMNEDLRELLSIVENFN